LLLVTRYIVDSLKSSTDRICQRHHWGNHRHTGLLQRVDCDSISGRKQYLPQNPNYRQSWYVIRFVFVFAFVFAFLTRYSLVVIIIALLLLL